MNQKSEPDHAQNLGQSVGEFMSDGVDRLPDAIKRLVMDAIQHGAVLRFELDIDALGSFKMRGLLVEDATSTELFSVTPRAN